MRLRVTEVVLDVVGDRPALHAYTVCDNVVVMPPYTGSAIADLYRYHAFVERFGCDPDAWLEHLRARGRGGSGDARMARWLRERMRRDPNFIDDVRRLVTATPIEETVAAR